MKIAMFGLKGIPIPTGAENVAEQIGSRLVCRGHEVIVYVRPHYTPKENTAYCGMKLVSLPSVPSRNLDAITHSFLCSLAVLASGADIAHIHSTGNSIFAPVLKLRHIKTVVQSHGLDWQRAKWGRFARAYLKMTDYTTTHFPDATTAVSRKLQNYFQTKYERRVVYIPNGANSAEKIVPQEMRRLGLEGNDYIFFAARLVPEKGAHYLIDAYKRLKNPRKKLVIAGDANYDSCYARGLKAQADENIIFPGFVRGRLLQELMSNAYLFVLPSEIEGLSTALLEAMSYGNCVLVSDIEENCEAIGDSGITFRNTSVDDLAEKLTYLLKAEAHVHQMREQALQHVQECYNWDTVTDQYEALYKSMLGTALNQHKLNC